MTPNGRPAALVPVIALSLVRQHLRALRDWHLEAEDGMSVIVQELAVSVEHAEFALKKFDDRFPSPRELRDALVDCRSRFFREPSLKEKWEAEGYRYTGHLSASEIMNMAYKPGAPTKHELMWQAIKRHGNVKEFSRVPLGQCYQWQKELGFPLDSYKNAGTFEQDELERYLSLPENKKSVPAPSVPTIPALSTEPPAIRCEKCSSTGRTEEGSYCTCATGRDLARVEAPRESSDANEDWDNLPASNL